jgi:Amt family ammonium transporter
MNDVLCLCLIALTPLIVAGLALIHQGLGRSRSAAHTMLATLCAVAIAAVVFVVLGSAWAGFAGGYAHILTVRGVAWDWLGAEPFFADGLRGPGDHLHALLVLCLEMFAAGIVALIPISTGSDRWRLAAVCASSAMLAAIVFPLFAHWIWGGGWLARLGGPLGLSSFVDAGGAGVVQVLGGLAALSPGCLARGAASTSPAWPPRSPDTTSCRCFSAVCWR